MRPQYSRCIPLAGSCTLVHRIKPPHMTAHNDNDPQGTGETLQTMENVYLALSQHYDCRGLDEDRMRDRLASAVLDEWRRDRTEATICAAVIRHHGPAIEQARRTPVVSA
jgi:hypothetical protein